MAAPVTDSVQAVINAIAATLRTFSDNRATRIEAEIERGSTRQRHDDGWTRHAPNQTATITIQINGGATDFAD